MKAQLEGKWSTVIAASAVVVSLAALLISWLSWKDSHSQLLLSMKPSIGFEKALDSDHLPVGLSLGNAGPGPGVVKYITYYVDRKLVGDLDKLVNFESLGNDIETYNFEEGDTVAVGQHEWLLSFIDKPHGKEAEDKLDRFVELIDHHLAVEVQVCSALSDHCVTKCSTKGWCR